MSEPVKTIAIIGCGNLGSALARGFARSGHSLILFDRSAEKLRCLEQELGARIAREIEQTVAADILVCAVKPREVSDVLTGIRQALAAQKPQRLLISVAAGISIETIRTLLGPSGSQARIVRVMPNVACLIGEGLSGIFASVRDDADAAATLFRSVGEVVICGEEIELNVVTALGASAPAFIFLAIEALAEGGIRLGLARDQALQMAANMVKGSALLMLQSGKHPRELRDSVASPGGTTIAGLKVLEEKDFSGTLISAIEASARRAAELSEKK